MYIKVFRFRVSNATNKCFTEDKEKDWYKRTIGDLVSEEQIEKRVNNFIKDKENVSISVTPVDVHYHNNGRSNTIDLIYTITYER